MVKGLAINLSMAVLFASFASSQPLLTKPTLVTTDWLAQNLGNKNIRIIDARPNLRDYLDGHIPNAIYLNTETLRVSLGGVPARLLPLERLAEIFGAIGVSNQHTVVVYSSGNDFFSHATYIAFALELLGHRAIGVLDGGYEKWQGEGRPITKEFPKFLPAKFVPKVNEQLRVDWLTVWRSLQGKVIQVLDARSPKDFTSGHIPTAKNAFLRDNLQGEKVLTWKSKDELLERFKALKIDLQKPIVTYCNSGRESSQLWFTLRHILGAPTAVLYDGSWIDWSSRKLPKE
ncbi:MAG: sulfurtransferase [Armatimonadetes bacterium]|nr:sulfurtransferase [Armatimonadota bacterium]MCX7967747.1 sulfurtransferase [Armatimonadota bacterium]MDW8144453.1 sulfurtransferase [Armatimonadota bacterium]